MLKYARAALFCLACSLALTIPARAEGGQGTSFFDSINAVLSGFDVGLGGTIITSEYKDTRLAGRFEDEIIRRYNLKEPFEF